MEKLKNLWDKISSTCSKWSSLNAPGTENSLSYPFLELGEFPFLILALWGNKNWPPSIKVQKFENQENKIGLRGCKWSSLNAPGIYSPEYHSSWENSIFKFFVWSIFANASNERAVIHVIANFLPMTAWIFDTSLWTKNLRLAKGLRPLYRGAHIYSTVLPGFLLYEFECPRHLFYWVSLRLGEFHIPISAFLSMG